MLTWCMYIVHNDLKIFGERLMHHISCICFFQGKLCHIDILKDVIRKIMDIVQAAPVCGWHAVYGQYRKLLQ